MQKNILSQKMCTDMSSHCTVPRTPGTGLAPMVAALPAAVRRSARERRQRNALRESDRPLYLRESRHVWRPLLRSAAVAAARASGRKWRQVRPVAAGAVAERQVTRVDSQVEQLRAEDVGRICAQQVEGDAATGVLDDAQHLVLEVAVVESLLP